MKTKTLLSGIYALLVSTSAVAQQANLPPPSPGDFSLPPAPTPTPTDVQGPVDPDAPFATQPRAPSPTPSPTPAPAPTPAPRPTPTRSPVEPTGTSLPPRFTPAPTTQPSDIPGSPASAAAADAALEEGDSGNSTITALPTPTTQDAAPPDVTASNDDGSNGTSTWLLALLGALGLAAAAGAAFALLRRKSNESVPLIEPPKVAPPPSSPPPSSPPPEIPSDQATVGTVVAKTVKARPDAISIPRNAKSVSAIATPAIDAIPISLSRSMMNATLTFELVVTNRSGRRVEGVSLEADLVSAHGREPAERQLADPATPLGTLDNTGPIDAGESRTIRAEVRLPVPQIRPLGTSPDRPYIPLLRVRVLVAGETPMARTYVVGKVSPNQRTRVLPFLLSDMPQVHTDIGLKPLD